MPENLEKVQKFREWSAFLDQKAWVRYGDTKNNSLNGSSKRNEENFGKNYAVKNFKIGRTKDLDGKVWCHGVTILRKISENIETAWERNPWYQRIDCKIKTLGDEAQIIFLSRGKRWLKKALLVVEAGFLSQKAVIAEEVRKKASINHQ